MTPTRVEIVPARRAGVTGYANVGRGTLLGNPYQVGTRVLSRSQYVTISSPSIAVALFLGYWNDPTNDGLHRIALALLSRDWPDGVVRLGCPCNGVEKGLPCHATVIKEYLEAEIARRAEK